MFAFCELGFRNEVFVRMFSRHVASGSEIRRVGRKFDIIHFVMEGRVNMVDEDGLCIASFPSGSIIGDYQILFGLRSIFDYTAAEDDECEHLHFLAIDQDDFNDLLELYPNTRDALQDVCLLKR